MRQQLLQCLPWVCLSACLSARCSWRHVSCAAQFQIFRAATPCLSPQPPQADIIVLGTGYNGRWAVKDLLPQELQAKAG